MLAYLLALMLISSPASEKVETAVKAYVENNFPIENSEYEYDFHHLNWEALPADIDSVQVFKIAKDSPLGNTIFTLGFFQGGRLEKSIPVAIGVSMLVDALVTAGPINVGESIQGLTPAKRSVTGRGEMPLTDSTFLEGKIASRYIPAGSILYSSMVEPKPVVSPGG